MKNYYDMLEIATTASEEVIRAAYKAKVKKWHPDNFSGTQEKETATKMLQDLNEGLEILTDAEKRRRYDEQLRSSSENYQRRSSSEEEQRREKEKAREKEKKKEDWEEQKYQEVIASVQQMIVLTRSEAEYLQLHRKIRALSCPDSEKLLMAEALDYLTSLRLEEEIRCADSLAHYKKEVSDTKSGMLLWVLIGFFASAWFSKALLIGIILAILTYVGNAEDRRELKRAKRAEAYVREYRLNGFRI